MKSKLTVAFLFLLSFFSFWASPVRAESIPDKPPLSGVYDPHGYLSKKVVEKVATFNWEYSKTKLQPQIAVVVVDTVDDDIETVARETARSWHVGFSDTNYGTLVLISIKDRKIRTETSNNMGTIIPDAEAAELNDLVKSDFRNKNYSEGVLTYLSAFKSKIDDHEYTGHTAEKDGITTHVYEPIKHEVPGDAPKYDIPELKVTRHVDEKDKELIETEKGIQPPRKTIGEHEYTGLTTEKDGITTHVYKSIKHEVPGDAPIVDIPELKATRYVNEKGEEIKESEAGFIDAPKTIGDYEFTGKTELNDGKDVQTHIYKLVEKPVMPTPDPKKPETRQPEAPKSIETPKSNDSVVVESAEQPQFVKNELPKTGETNSNLALVGVSVLTSLGSIGFIKRKREE